MELPASLLRRITDVSVYRKLSETPDKRRLQFIVPKPTVSDPKFLSLSTNITTMTKELDDLDSGLSPYQKPVSLASYNGGPAPTDVSDWSTDHKADHSPRTPSGSFSHSFPPVPPTAVTSPNSGKS
jgi:hypothetical protein